MTTVLGRPITLEKVRNGKRDKELRIPIIGKAAIYIRVSGHRQEDGASLDVQLDACRRYCESHGLLVVGEFRDVQSGLDADRPEYRAVKELARTNSIDKVVVWRYDRMGRDSAEYIPLLKDLRRLGVDVVSVTQPTGSIFMQQVIGIMAEEESRQLSTRVTASKQRRFKEGKWGGSPPFGYITRKLSQTEGGGSILMPNEDAPLVVELYQRYGSGKHSLADLRSFLNGAGHVKSRYAVWYVLKNQVYLGMVPHGKFSRSQFMPKPEITWVQGQHQALVDQELFDRVQGRLAENANRNRGGAHPRYLFSGLIYCGNCGHKFSGRAAANGQRIKKWIQYRCSRKSSFGDCPAHSVLEGRIRDAVLPPIQDLLGKLKQEDLRTAVRAELVNQQEGAKVAHQQTREGLAEAQTRLEARLSRLEDRYLDEDLSRERYLIRRDEITAQLQEIQKDLATRPQLASPDIDQLFALADVLEGEPPDDQEWREIIEAMVDRVVIEGAVGEGRKTPATVKVVWKDAYGPLLGMVT